MTSALVGQQPVVFRITRSNETSIQGEVMALVSTALVLSLWSEPESQIVHSNHLQSIHLIEDIQANMLHPNFWACHAPSQLDPGELSHTCIHLTMDHDLTQLNALPCMGNAEHSPTWTSLGRQGQCIDSMHAIFIHLTYNTLCFM